MIQGYNSPYAFILGRRSKYTNKGTIISSNNCLKSLGTIDYTKNDKKYIN